jgi:hypothetical protein
MIQAAASSLPSSLALGTGAQAAAGDDAVNSGAFATVLTASMATGQDEATTGSGPAIDPAAGPVTGNTAGKILPDPTGIAGSTQFMAEATSVGATAAMPTAVVSEIVLPGLTIPAKTQLSQASKPAAEAQTDDPSTAENLAKTIAALLGRATRSGTAQGTPTTKPAKTQGKTEEPAAATEDGGTATTPAAVTRAPLPLVIPVAISVGAQPIETQALAALAARSAPDQPAPAIATAASSKAPAPTDTIAAAVPVTAAETADRIVVNFALPQAPAEQTSGKLKPTVQQLAAHQPDALPLTVTKTQERPLRRSRKQFSFRQRRSRPPPRSSRAGPPRMMS